MRILAIDTSCDESSVAILDVEEWKLLADVVESHVSQMTRYGGVVPEIASREHIKGLPLAIDEALKKANLKLKDIDWFVVTSHPGLIGALLVGVSFTKALAFSESKPFSVVNHIECHLYSPLLGTLEGQKVPPFPWLALVVSGGHTELFHVRAVNDYTWLGGTLDDAAGEAFDKIGKLLQMHYPAGPQIDKLVKEKATDTDRTAFTFPRAKTDGFTFSYSGMKTAVNNQSKKLEPLTEEKKLQLLASAQEAILDPLVDKVRAAKEKFPTANIVVTGGVACNSRLREKLPEAYFPKPMHCTDNAAMVALLGALLFKEGKLNISSWTAAAKPSWDPERAHGPS